MPSRRTVLRSLVAFAGASVVPSSAAPRTYGYLAAATCFERTGHSASDVRIAFDGANLDLRDQRVMAADDRAGYIEVLLRDANGSAYVDPVTQRLARRKRYGQVVVTFAQRATA